MTLRPYQQEAHDAAIDWIKRNRSPCVIEAATGAGKSHIIAALGATVHAISKGKHVLVLQPSAELVDQNAEKYRATGAKCSIFSASAGEKSLRHPVVFGTPLTVKNRISRFGNQFAVVIIDECHGITPTVMSIIEAMREANPNLRVVGLSATPYRMMTGYIFSLWPDGKPVRQDETRDPYFGACVYRIRARSLIDQGYLTLPVIGSIGVASYETMNMQLNGRGQFDADDIDRAFHGHGRKTADIISDIIGQSRGRNGVMIFAATVRHAQECLASLPPSLSALVTGETPKVERKRILADFKARKLKYLVNVSVLTTGFDAPHVDVIAILRATESVGLLQQIVGRGLRLFAGKTDCVVLDYAQNIDRHCPDGDIFSPEIKVRGGEKGEGSMTCTCPECNVENEFTPRPNEEGYAVDINGYFLDLDGNRVETEWGAMPAHFGRRCLGMSSVAGNLVRCGYRWTSKPCPKCEEANDIAARYCTKCKAEIVDPNEKLRIDFKALKKDPTKVQTDEVISWKVIPSVSRTGKETDRVDVVTPYRSFSFWVLRYPTFSKAMREREMLEALGGRPPMTITYQKDAETGFYRAIAFNRAKDEAPTGHPDLGKRRVQRSLPEGNSGTGDLFRPPAQGASSVLRFAGSASS
jgi:DNA repair protein RadD